MAEPTKATTNEQMLMEMVKAAMKELLPTVMAATQMSNSNAAPSGRPLSKRVYQQCELCRQDINYLKDKDGKDVADPNIGCGGEHELMVVLPKTPAAIRAFQFVGINGRQYTSANASHRVYVPKKAVGAFQRMLDDHDQNEEQLTQSRKGESRAHLAYNGGAAQQLGGLGAGWR
jgi:hypothetical protein